MTIAKATRQALGELGAASIAELAAHIGADINQRPAMGHALRQGLGIWAERVGRGQYVWLNGSRPAKASTTDELQPLVDSLNVEFGRVGLNYVARTQDGAFVCTDQHGVAWRVEVAVTAKLL